MKFERRSRLSTNAEYQRVFARPAVSQDRYFRVLGRPNGLTFARLGLAVSARICRTAVGRNRLKRLIRESFRQHQQDLADGGGLDTVVLPLRKAATVSNQALAASLATHWRRIGSGQSAIQKDCKVDDNNDG